MTAFLSEYADQLRVATFFLVLLSMMFAEYLMPGRKYQYKRTTRWRTNISIIVLDTLFARLILPLSVIGVAQLVSDRGYGLFNYIALPSLLELIFILLIFDLAIYLQHLASHKFPVLWRIHKMHHADPDFDATTGFRFHPFEIALSMIYKYLLILLFGPSVIAVIVFETILSSMAIFSHANLRLPAAVDRVLRLVIVTPDVHRIHHSVDTRETDSNYGFNLTVWDRIFQTWIEQPAKGHEQMEIGIKRYQNANPTKVGWSLLLPFSKES